MIENEGNYTQKNLTFDITHMCSRNDTAMKNHYLFIQIAHIIGQLLEKGSINIKGLFLKLKEISELIYESLISNPNHKNLLTNFQLRFDT